MLGLVCQKMMHLVGMIMIIFFFGLFLMLFYSYVYDICQIYYIASERNIFVGLSMLIVGYYLAFCVIFNYIMAIFVHPGKTTRRVNSRSYLNGQDSDDDEEEVLDASNHIIHATNSSNTLIERVCRKCNQNKPPRTHHCSICNECIYKMDHHCPWIDNCVGYENHRYFLSLILYLLISTVYMNFLYWNIESNPQLQNNAYNTKSLLYPLTQILTLLLSVILIFFNCWNFFLACSGCTVIEFWSQKKTNGNESISSFASPSILENLYQIFGTTSLFKMMLPSIRPLPHNGTKWSLYHSSIVGDTNEDLENQTETHAHPRLRNNASQFEDGL